MIKIYNGMDNFVKTIYRITYEKLNVYLLVTLGIIVKVRILIIHDVYISQFAVNGE